MRNRWLTGALCIALLPGCGGDGQDGGGAVGGVPTQAPTPSPTPAATPSPTASAGCSLRERQDWALATLREWYLFPDTLPANPDPAGSATVSDYVDRLTATARAQRRDRFFTYVTSIAEENAYYEAGSSAGFGLRFGLDTTNRLYVTEAFETAPGLNAGIDRGAEITAIGTSGTAMQPVSSIIATQGTSGLAQALGPDTPGTTRVLRIVAGGVSRDVTLTKANFVLAPVSERYGAKVIDDGGRRVGYVNLRTFIGTAEQPLRAAFARFRAEGIAEIIVDLRYNGGGLLAVSDLVGDLMGRGRAASDVWSFTNFRPEKAANNATRFFQPQAESIAPTRVAFIGTGGTASASEVTINGAIPYLRTNAALIGTNTFGKPVGQIAIDRPACDDRLRVVALATQNAARRGDYYDGLANVVEASCRAGDDLGYPMGDPREASTRQALDFIAGRSCTPIGGLAASATASATRSAGQAPSVQRALLSPDRPSTAQRETPGLF